MGSASFRSPSCGVQVITRMSRLASVPTVQPAPALIPQSCRLSDFTFPVSSLCFPIPAIAVQPSFSTIHCKSLSQTLLPCYPSPCLPSSIFADTFPAISADGVYSGPVGASECTLSPLEGPQTVLSSFIFQTLNFQLLTFNLPRSLPPVSPLSATFTRLRASVANKRLTAKLNPLDATFTRNRGVGVNAQ